MRYAKRISVYILVGLLSVGSACGSYAQGVYAFEWVGGAIAFEEALKWLLGAIGICAGVGFTHDMWAEYGDDFTDYCIQREIDNSQVAQWKGKLASGVLDKASECWSAFLEWASSLVGSSDSEDFLPVGSSYADTVAFVNRLMGWNLPVRSGYDNVKVYAIMIYRNKASGNLYSCNLYTSQRTFQIPSNNVCNWGGHLSYFNIGSSVGFQVSSSQYTMNDSDSDYRISRNIVNLSTYDTTEIPFGEPVEGVGDSNFNTLDDVDTQNLGVISSDIPDEEDKEVAIPMPGVSTSDDTASASAYDDIVDAINDGTITLDDGITRIQELLRVIVYDTTTDDVIPVVDDPDTGEPIKKDDVIQDNKNNMGFTLAGLENVFPFCIPWDLYAFINILRADPVAPVFILPFPNPSDLEHPYQIRVDLSSWDDAMSIFRLAEDFLFIIGLAILTRSLIGAGGGDG